MTDFGFIITTLRYIILQSMTKTAEAGIACVEEIVLNSAMAKAYRNGIAECGKIPIKDLSLSPQPALEPFQSVIGNFDGVWLIEDTHAYQPMVIGRPVTALERKARG